MLLNKTATKTALRAIKAERATQDARWGEQNHPMISDTHPMISDTQAPSAMRQLADYQKRTNARRAEQGTLEWYAILLEEVYEAFAETDPAKQLEEMTQVAAVATAIMEMLQRQAIYIPREGDVVSVIDGATRRRAGGGESTTELAPTAGEYVVKMDGFDDDGDILLEAPRGYPRLYVNPIFVTLVRRADEPTPAGSGTPHPRPLKVGDVVDVAEDAVWGYAGRLSSVAGGTAIVIEARPDYDGDLLVRGGPGGGMSYVRATQVTPRAHTLQEGDVVHVAAGATCYVGRYCCSPVAGEHVVDRLSDVGGPLVWLKPGPDEPYRVTNSVKPEFVTLVRLAGQES